MSDHPTFNGSESPAEIAKASHPATAWYDYYSLELHGEDVD